MGLWGGGGGGEKGAEGAPREDWEGDEDERG